MDLDRYYEIFMKSHNNNKNDFRKDSAPMRLKISEHNDQGLK